MGTVTGAYFVSQNIPAGSIGGLKLPSVVEERTVQLIPFSITGSHVCLHDKNLIILLATPQWALKEQRKNPETTAVIKREEPTMG